MASLSVTSAWNETVAFVKAEARLLFPLTFMLVALPAAVTGALVPTTTSPGQPPQAGAWLIAAVVATIFGLIGYAAISYLALRPSTSVGEALRRAGRRTPSLLGAALLVLCGLLAIGFLLSLIASLVVVGASAGQPPGNEEMMRALLILMLLYAPVMIYLFARLMVLPAVGAAESGGPFSIVSRSWRLGRHHVWKLVAVILIVAMVTLVLQLAVTSVIGLLLFVLAGPAQPGSLPALALLLVMAMLNTVLNAYVATLVARIYAQLAGSGRDGGRMQG